MGTMYKWHGSHHTLDAMLDELVDWWLTAGGQNDDEFVKTSLALADEALADQMIEEADLREPYPYHARDGRGEVSHMAANDYGRDDVILAFERYRKRRQA